MFGKTVATVCYKTVGNVWYKTVGTASDKSVVTTIVKTVVSGVLVYIQQFPPGSYRSNRRSDRPGGLSFCSRVLGVSKPSISIVEQIAQLTTRGLLDSDNELSRALVDHGYFRLSGYWRYFQIDPRAGRNAFEHGSDFRDVYDVYSADADLRNLLLEGLAELEIALRAMLTAKLCARGGEGAEYLREDIYVDWQAESGEELRIRLLVDIKSDIGRSKEKHVRHYRTKDPASVPLWVAMEALSFGTISRIYGLLKDDGARDAIAARFGYDGRLSSAQFATNLRAIAVFRNVCAHHGRIWNRQIRQDVPRIFKGLIAQGMSEQDYRNNSWGVVAVLNHMVRHVRRDNSFQQMLDKQVPRSGTYWTGLVAPSDM